MSVTLKPYPSYKDAGVPWLGEVPEHWEVWRLKYVFPRIIGGSTPSSTEPDYWDGDVVWITPTDVSKAAKLRNSLRKITYKGLQSCSSQLVPSGSIVVTSRAPVGNVAIAETELCTNQGCKALVVNDAVLNPMFGFHALNTLKSELKSLATGTTFTEISTSRLSAVSMPLPPLHEQSTIVRFLDHYDRKIRRFIHAKQKLIKLLEEQKQAIISKAVTRGLDPNVRLKPSGVEWLGDVPEHWEVRRLKWCASLNPSRTEARTLLDKTTLVTFLPMERVGVDGRIDVGEILNASAVWSGFTYFRRGDILVAKITPCFENGKGACLNSLPTEFGFGSTEFHVLRAKSNILETFLYCLTTVSQFRRLGADAMTGAAGQQRIPQAFVANFPIAIPPLPEQAAIVQFVDQAIVGIVSAIDRAQNEITFIREYRTRLIADVVTGKLDVRSVPIEEPEEIEELPEYEALDDESSMSEEVGELEDADN